MAVGTKKSKIGCITQPGIRSVALRLSTFRLLLAKVTGKKTLDNKMHVMSQ